MNQKYQEMIESYFSAKESDLVEAVSRLVSIPSTKGDAQPGMPFGPGPAAALEEAVQMALELGLSVKNLEGYVGVADLNDLETQVHILAHLDVVAPGDGWTVTEPYTPKLVDGLLYGRGTDDDKGPLVATLFAMKAVKDLGIPLQKNARLIMGTDEECGFADINWYYSHYPYAPCAFSPDAEFPLINIEKGHYRPVFGKTWTLEPATPRVISLTGGHTLNVVPNKSEALLRGISYEQLRIYCDQIAPDLEVTFTLSRHDDGVQILSFGQAAHASTPEEGVNALTALLVLLTKLPLGDCASTRAIHDLAALFPHGDTRGNALGINQTDESGDLTVNFSQLTLGEQGFTARFDSRIPLCATNETCREKVEAAFARSGISVLSDAELGPVHSVPADSPFVKFLLECYEQYTGQKGECLAIGGGTYVHDIPDGVAFGAHMPEFDSGLHGPNEKAEVSTLLTAAKIYTQAIIGLCS